MLRVIFNIVEIIFATVGFVETLHCIVSVFFKTSQESEMIILLPIYGHNEEAELILKGIASKINCFDVLNKKKVVCLDLGMDRETKQICNIISRQYDFISVLAYKDLKLLLKNKGQTVSLYK